MMSARLVSTFALISIAFTPANAEVIRDEDGPMIGAFKVGDGCAAAMAGWQVPTAKAAARNWTARLKSALAGRIRD